MPEITNKIFLPKPLIFTKLTKSTTTFISSGGSIYEKKKWNQSDNLLIALGKVTMSLLYRLIFPSVVLIIAQCYRYLQEIHNIGHSIEQHMSYSTPIQLVPIMNTLYDLLQLVPKINTSVQSTNNTSSFLNTSIIHLFSHILISHTYATICRQRNSPWSSSQ